MVTTAFSAGGRRAATCRPLNPPQEMPIIPTSPLHHSCAASQAITSSASSCSCGEVLVVEQPVRVAAAAEVDPHAGEAVVGEVRVVAVVARRERVALAVRDVLEDGRDGLRIVRQPQPRREPRAVGQRDPDVVDPAH